MKVGDLVSLRPNFRKGFDPPMPMSGRSIEQQYLEIVK
jgi:hypothetical protein